MKATFDLMVFMKENREEVIEAYNRLTGEKYFAEQYVGGILTLKGFMYQVLNIMNANRPRSEKQARKILTYAIDYCYNDNSRIH